MIIQILKYIERITILKCISGTNIGSSTDQFKLFVKNQCIVFVSYGQEGYANYPSLLPFGYALFDLRASTSFRARYPPHCSSTFLHTCNTCPGFDFVGQFMWAGQTFEHPSYSVFQKYCSPYS